MTSNVRKFVKNIQRTNASLQKLSVVCRLHITRLLMHFQVQYRVHNSCDGRCVRLKIMPNLFANCVEILGSSKSWGHKGWSRPAQGLLYLKAQRQFAGSSIQCTFCCTRTRNFVTVAVLGSKEARCAVFIVCLCILTQQVRRHCFTF